MSYSVWLAESLAVHKRGRILQSTVNAVPLSECPSSPGMCLMFGADFQEGSGELQQKWLNWSQQPGQVVLLIPPFAISQCEMPTHWEIAQFNNAKTKETHPLVKTLAPEVRHELKGKLQIAKEIGGIWDDNVINTGYYRKHPHSGIFAITCLPLCSLIVLDHEKDLQDWLYKLYSLAGTPLASTDNNARETEFEARQEHFTVLLHLLSGHFQDKQTALDALDISSIFKISSTEAKPYFDELEKYGLTLNGQVTQSGHELLYQSPYAVYASALEAIAK